MTETRESYTLRFPPSVWKLITKRALALFGSEKSRARYLERLAWLESQQISIKYDENEISKRV